MTNDELIIATRKAAENLSFYNAAEGNCWKQETQKRAQAQSKFYEFSLECKKRNLDWKERKEDGSVVGYLI